MTINPITEQISVGQSNSNPKVGAMQILASNPNALPEAKTLSKTQVFAYQNFGEYSFAMKFQKAGDEIETAFTWLKEKIGKDGRSFTVNLTGQFFKIEYADGRIAYIDFNNQSPEVLQQIQKLQKAFAQELAFAQEEAVSYEFEPMAKSPKNGPVPAYQEYFACLPPKEKSKFLSEVLEKRGPCFLLEDDETRSKIEERLRNTHDQEVIPWCMAYVDEVIAHYKHDKAREEYQKECTNTQAVDQENIKRLRQKVEELHQKVIQAEHAFSAHRNNNLLNLVSTIRKERFVCEAGRDAVLKVTSGQDALEKSVKELNAKHREVDPTILSIVLAFLPSTDKPTSEELVASAEGLYQAVKEVLVQRGETNHEIAFDIASLIFSLIPGVQARAEYLHFARAHGGVTLRSQSCEDKCIHDEVKALLVSNVK